MRLTKQYSLLQDMDTFKLGTPLWREANREYRALMKRIAGGVRTRADGYTDYLGKYGKSYKEIISLLGVSHPTVTKWDRQGVLGHHINLKIASKTSELAGGHRPRKLMQG